MCAARSALNAAVQAIRRMENPDKARTAPAKALFALPGAPIKSGGPWGHRFWHG